MSRWSESDLKAVLDKSARETAARLAKPSKYKAVKTTVDGIVFDSKKEAQRYHELRLMEKAGEISGLITQPEYDLEAPGGGLVGRYLADFTYFDKKINGVVVEDVKGFKTALYRWKKKHVELQYGIQIRET